MKQITICHINVMEYDINIPNVSFPWNFVSKEKIGKVGIYASSSSNTINVVVAWSKPIVDPILIILHQ